MANFRYYLGPWAQSTDPVFGSYFHAPQGGKAVIDFRSISDASRNTFGLFAVPSQEPPLPQSDYTYLGFGYISYVTLSAQQKAVWQSALNLPSLPQGNTLADVVWDTLVRLADPEGLTRVPPLMPNMANVLEIHLAGHSIIRSAKFTLAAGTPQLAVIQKQYATHRKNAQDGKIKDKNGVVDPKFHLKVLDFWKDKFKLKGNAYRLIQGNLPDEPPVKHDTSLSDNFNRADSTSDLGGSWTALENNGLGEIKSNQAYCFTNTSGGSTDGGIYRHGSSLSSDDMETQIEIGSSGHNVTAGANSGWYLGVTARISDVNNFYLNRVVEKVGGFGDSWETWKKVSGTWTRIIDGADGYSWVAGDWVKLKTDGSSITGSRGGTTAQSSTVTDTSLAGSVRTGMYIVSYQDDTGVVSGYGDNWTAADLYQPPDTPSNFSASASDHETIDMTWTDVSTETSYDLDWSPDGIGSWTSLGPLAANTVEYAHVGLSPSTTYYYRLRATNADGSSSYVTANATTDAAPATGGGLTTVFAG